jgi:ATP-dependent protease ClpP protease subunit
MHPQEALDYGLIDHIFGEPNPVLETSDEE